MNRRTTLAAALHEVSGKKQIITTLKKPDGDLMLTNFATKPPSRIGKKVVAGHFDPAVIRQLKMLAIDNEASIQTLLTEALNDLFNKHNMKPIA